VIISFQAGLNLSKKDVGCLHVAYFAGSKIEFSLNKVFTFQISLVNQKLSSMFLDDDDIKQLENFK
jgi:hypothetical protein